MPDRSRNQLFYASHITEMTSRWSKSLKNCIYCLFRVNRYFSTSFSTIFSPSKSIGSTSHFKLRIRGSTILFEGGVLFQGSTLLGSAIWRSTVLGEYYLRESYFKQEYFSGEYYYEEHYWKEKYFFMGVLFLGSTIWRRSTKTGESKMKFWGSPKWKKYGMQLF